MIGRIMVSKPKNTLPYKDDKPAIKARFIGKSGCGFQTGKEYYIRTRIAGVVKAGVVLDGEYLCVYDTKSSAMCPYSRLETFLENWKIL